MACLNLEHGDFLTMTTIVLALLPAGPRSIQQIFRAAVFVFLPTSFELIAVCTVLTQASVEFKRLFFAHSIP